MARFNISKDSIYFPAGKRKGDQAGGISRLHTLQASNMSTIPLTYPQRPEMFHRPQGLWNPLVTKKLHVKNQSKLQSKRRCMVPVTLTQTLLSAVDWPHFAYQNIPCVLKLITPLPPDLGLTSGFAHGLAWSVVLHSLKTGQNGLLAKMWVMLHDLLHAGGPTVT